MTIEKQIILDNNYLKAEFLGEEEVMIVSAKKNYIKDEAFREAFIDIGNYIKVHSTKKLIFDKSALITFNQNSMIWYHVEWKPEMKRYGLRTYRKILPQDLLFKKSVEIGRENIKITNPEFNFEDYDIQYCNSVEEAMKL